MVREPTHTFSTFRDVQIFPQGKFRVGAWMMHPTENLLVGRATKGSGLSSGMAAGLLMYRVPELEHVGTVPIGLNGDYAFSRDGQLLAYAGARSIRVWDVTSKQELASLKPPGFSIWVPMRLAFYSRQRLFASYGDKKVLRWDVGAQTYHYLMTPNYKSRLAVQADGRMLITAGDHIDLWDSDTGEHVRSLDPEGTQDGTSMALSSDGRLAALGKKDQSVRVWDVEAGEVVQQLVVARTPHPISFSPNNELLVLTGDSWVSAWNLRTREECFSQQIEAPQFAGFTPDGRFLTVVTGNRAILWARE